MPLSPFQSELGRLLAKNRSEDSYLAGGAAILLQPRSIRYSQDLDYFHDSAARVAEAFKADFAVLSEAGIALATEISQPGYISAVARRGGQSTKLEWAHDSAWRFMPVQKSEDFGFILHPVDLATNKILALAGRDEARDLVDALYLHREFLGLGALVWAAVGKDPGYSPLSLLEALRKRGRARPEDLARLHVSEPLDAKEIKESWLAAMEAADTFVHSRPSNEVGCLYYSPEAGAFVVPDKKGSQTIQVHYGRPGGVLPLMVD